MTPPRVFKLTVSKGPITLKRRPSPLRTTYGVVANDEILQPQARELVGPGAIHEYQPCCETKALGPIPPPGKAPHAEAFASGLLAARRHSATTEWGEPVVKVASV